VCAIIPIYSTHLQQLLPPSPPKGLLVSAPGGAPHDISGPLLLERVSISLRSRERAGKKCVMSLEGATFGALSWSDDVAAVLHACDVELCSLPESRSAAGGSEEEYGDLGQERCTGAPGVLRGASNETTLLLL
jgi:hypothetical protein